MRIRDEFMCVYDYASFAVMWRFSTGYMPGPEWLIRLIDWLHGLVYDGACVSCLSERQTGWGETKVVYYASRYRICNY